MRVVPTFSLLLLLACGDDGGEMPPDGGETLPADPCDVRLDPSADDQTALQSAFIDAAEGSTICLSAGTYHLTDELSLSQKGITVRGLGVAHQTVLDFSAQAVGASGISVTGSDFAIEDLTIQDTKKDGIKAKGVTNVAFRRVRVIWTGVPDDQNGAYGFYPVESTNVLVEGCEVVGASDAGIYVGQAHNIIVQGNLVHQNVAGIEIENSTDADVSGNVVTDNVGGILVFNLPDLPIKDGRRTRVHHNSVHFNNHFRFAEQTAFVGMVPIGTGIIVLANDEVELHDNLVVGNDSGGALVVSYLAVGSTADTAYDVYPETVWFHDNQFLSNGNVPEGLALAVGHAPVEDIVWDGFVGQDKDNSDGHLSICLTSAESNHGATFYDVALGGTERTTIEDHFCSHAPLAPVVFVP